MSRKDTVEVDPVIVQLQHELGDAGKKLAEYRQRMQELEAKLQRRKMPEERQAVTHKFTIHSVDEEGVARDFDGYLIVGLYEDGQPGELFLRMDKLGGTVAGFCDCWAIAMSLLLQKGEPLKDLCARYKFTRFPPAGMTDTPGIVALSPIDYVAKWLERRFCA